MNCFYCKKRVVGKHGWPWRHDQCVERRSVSQKQRRDPEAIIQEYGAKKLSETQEGRRVLENARQKYRVELLQPGDPEFNKYYGKEIARKEKDRRELEAESRRLKGEARFA